LTGAYRLGKRPIRQLASDLLGLSISTGMIARLERQGAAELEAPVEELRRYVRTAAVAHIDETSWRQGRDKAWLWGAVTNLVTVLTIATSRGAEVAKGILGTAAAKVVVSDRFKGYAWVKRRQFCWAHRNRDLQAMIDRGGASRPRSVGGCWGIPSGCSDGGTGSGTGRWPGPPCSPEWPSCGSPSGTTWVVG
jgi:transposase